MTDENPYQVWMLALSLTDKRGLLRVIPNPRARQIPWEGELWQGDSWWNLAGGLPRSGDNAILLLEDGTIVHMSALGMHSNFGDTISVNSVYGHSVRIIGSYPHLDHISWPHEFERSRDFALIWSKAAPSVPIVMIDLEHACHWTVAVMNYRDLADRSNTAKKLQGAGARGSGRDGANLFLPTPNPNPDFTKTGYASSMLTIGHPEYRWGNAYIAVARYPQPPANLRRLDGKRARLPDFP